MDNKIINGDTTIELGKLEHNSIDAIITDPPYGVEFKNDFYNDSKEYVFGNIETWYQGWYDVLKEGKYLFVFVPTKEIHNWIQTGIKIGFQFKNILTTEAHFIGRSFRPKNNFEFKAQPILVFSKGKSQDLYNYDFIPTSKSWFKDKRNTNPKEFTYIYPNIIGKDIVFANTKSTAKNSKSTTRHPNEKNIDLLKFLIGISTKENEVVLDTFMGSGSTCWASNELNRKFVGIEQDKDYFDNIKRRLENE